MVALCHWQCIPGEVIQVSGPHALDRISTSPSRCFVMIPTRRDASNQSLVGEVIRCKGISELGLHRTEEDATSSLRLLGGEVPGQLQQHDCGA